MRVSCKAKRQQSEKGAAQKSGQRTSPQSINRSTDHQHLQDTSSIPISSTTINTHSQSTKWQTMYHDCRRCRRLSRPEQGAQWTCLASMSSCGTNSEQSTVNPPSLPSRQFPSILPTSLPPLSHPLFSSLLVLDVPFLILLQTSTCGWISNNTPPSAASTSASSAAPSSSPHLISKKTSPQTAAAHDPVPSPPPPSTTPPQAPSKNPLYTTIVRPMPEADKSATITFPLSCEVRPNRAFIQNRHRAGE